jgi:hypothetical protein
MYRFRDLLARVLNWHQRNRIFIQIIFLIFILSRSNIQFLQGKAVPTTAFEEPISAIRPFSARSSRPAMKIKIMLPGSDLQHNIVHSDNQTFSRSL